MFKWLENLKKAQKKTVKKVKKKLPRYQKVVTSFLYFMIFAVIIYTFWEFNYVGESVGPEIYDKTLEVLLGLLGITGSLKVSENVTDAVTAFAKFKYKADTPTTEVETPGVEMRGGE